MAGGVKKIRITLTTNATIECEVDAFTFNRITKAYRESPFSRTMMTFTARGRNKEIRIPHYTIKKIESR